MNKTFLAGFACCIYILMLITATFGEIRIGKYVLTDNLLMKWILIVFSIIAVVFYFKNYGLQGDN